MTDRLPDGWGADTPRDDTLVRAYTEAYADLTTELGRAAGARTTRNDEWAAMDSHAPFPFFNVAVLLRPLLGPADPLIAEAAAFFAPDDEDTPFLVWSATPTPDLSARGWSLMGHPPLMLRPVAPADPPEPAGLEIVPVTDPDMVRVFESTIIDAYPVPGMQGRSVFGASLLDVPAWHMWLGLVDGSPAGTAAARVAGSMVDVEWISTRAEHRGRRIGEALTWAATRAAPELPAMLIASDLGQPVYERMGYLRLARVTLWIGARSA